MIPELWRLTQGQKKVKYFGESTLQLGLQGIKPVNPKGNPKGICHIHLQTMNIQDWCWSWNCKIWSPDTKNWLTGKDPDDGKDWKQEKKRTTEDEMVEWHHGLDGHEIEHAAGVGDGQGSLAWFSPWGLKSQTWLSYWTNHWHSSIFPKLFIMQDSVDNSQPSWRCVCVHAKLLQSCPTLCDSADCSPPECSLFGFLQARILKWVAMVSSKGSSWPREQTHNFTSPALVDTFFTMSTTWKPQSWRYISSSDWEVFLY